MTEPVVPDTCSTPAWAFAEEWAVLSEDGAVYGVDGDRRDVAERELGLLRAGGQGDPERLGEPGARLVTRFKAVHRATGRAQFGAWTAHPTPGDPPSPVPAYLRGGFTC